MKNLKQIDGYAYPCCKRYYYHSQHSYPCQKENNLSVNEDINYAELPKIKLSNPASERSWKNSSSSLN